MSWSEEIKRNVVRSSVQVHRRKGTVFAVKEAVRAVYSDSEIQEWFQYGGNPYHFKIGVFAGSGEGFSYQLTDEIKAVAFSAKNVRSKLEAVQIIFRNIGDSPKLAVVTQTSFAIQVYPNFPRALTFAHSSSRFATYLNQLQTITIYPKV